MSLNHILNLRILGSVGVASAMIAHIVKNDSAFVNWQKSITKLFFIQNHLELGRLWPPQLHIKSLYDGH